jgi:hypothetical protein
MVKKKASTKPGGGDTRKPGNLGGGKKTQPKKK